MEPTTDRLAADLDLVEVEHQDRDGLAAPTAAEKAEGGRRRGGNPCDDDFDPVGGEAKGTAGLVPGQALHPLLMELLDPAVDGARATEQERTDGGPGVALGQQQQEGGVEADLGVG